VLFQPYIELAEGWDPTRLRGERYRAACCLQAEIVLQAGSWLGRAGQWLVPKEACQDEKECVVRSVVEPHTAPICDSRAVLPWDFC